MKNLFFVSTAERFVAEELLRVKFYWNERRNWIKNQIPSHQYHPHLLQIQDLKKQKAT